MRNASHRPLVRLLPASVLVVAMLAGAAGSARALEPGEFDPAPFDSLLGAYVRDGAVDYAAWKEGGLASLDRFLDAGADYDLTSILGKEPRAAFLINAYNAWAIRQIVAAWPVERLQDIPGFFDKNRREIAGKERSLSEIEADLDAMLPHQPDFAFTLSPGAADMPALAGQAYRSENFLRRLRMANVAYLRGPNAPAYDREANTLLLPPPFRGRLERYAALPNQLAGFLADYLPLADVVALSKASPEVKVAESSGILRKPAAPAPADSTGSGR